MNLTYKTTILLLILVLALGFMVYTLDPPQEPIGKPSEQASLGEVFEYAHEPPEGRPVTAYWEYEPGYFNVENVIRKGSDYYLDVPEDQPRLLFETHKPEMWIPLP